MMILKQTNKTKNQTGFYKIRPEQQRNIYHLLTYALDRLPLCYMCDTDLFYVEQLRECEVDLM